MKIDQIDYEMHTDSMSLMKITWSLVLVLLLQSHDVFGQTLTTQTNYYSEVDNSLSIKKIVVFPSLDNLQGLYARPLEEELKKIIREDHRFELEESNAVGTIYSPDNLANNPTQVKSFIGSTQAQVGLSLGIFKSPAGFNLKLFLFSQSDGRVLIQKERRGLKQFEIEKLKSEINTLYREVISALPYDGLVLSRKLTRVTINLGLRDGIKKGMTIPVIQIIRLKRHPKFGFIVGADKEILGQIEITKVDKTISFGSIVSEREEGIIQVSNKVAGISSVEYGSASLNSPESIGSGQRPLKDREDAEIAFGKDPEEWKPQPPPTFGEVGVSFGLGLFNNKTQLSTAGSLEAKSSAYPRVSLYGELWVNPEWIIRADLVQGIISSDNPLSGSSPGELSQSLSKYSLQAGYNYAFLGDFFGPKVQVLVGFSQARVFVDDTDPRGLTTTTFSGFMISLVGSFPITFAPKWTAGAKLNFYLFPQLEEEPVSSGRDSSNSINEFRLFSFYKWKERIHFYGSVEVSLYTSSFSGNGSRTDDANNLSQSDTAFNGGIRYLF